MVELMTTRIQDLQAPQPQPQQGNLPVQQPPQQGDLPEVRAPMETGYFDQLIPPEQQAPPPTHYQAGVGQVPPPTSPQGGASPQGG